MLVSGKPNILTPKSLQVYIATLIMGILYSKKKKSNKKFLNTTSFIWASWQARRAKEGEDIVIGTLLPLWWVQQWNCNFLASNTKSVASHLLTSICRGKYRVTMAAMYNDVNTKVHNDYHAIEGKIGINRWKEREKKGEKVIISCQPDFPTDTASLFHYLSIFSSSYFHYIIVPLSDC